MWPFSEMSLARATWLSDFANIVLVGSLVCGVLSTYVIVRTASIKEQYWDRDRQESRERIAALTTRADELRRDTAAANERAARAEQQAAEANLELERLKTPRTLSPEGQRRIADKLKPFERTPYVITVFDEPEVLDLMTQIEGALASAGWAQIPWSEGPIVYKRPDKPAIGFNFLTGLFIQADDSRASDLGVAAVALADALKLEGLAATSQVGQMPAGMNKDGVNIQIGKKAQ
jgi:hypothetical protein